ncbi:histidine kinase [Marinomonas sp. S3726]|uniref:bifunctional diguanylate cyclase/phosphodiesterase n=1 Tax=Marinomonas sp. S3726 TaxID=579484 RepID=UPI0005F9D7DB|nr:EAL domain-containing protein [Marinomonas sp. S3726]KJZ13701.1 histidine kinase [Marinomonas sp. S3726]
MSDKNKTKTQLLDEIANLQEELSLLNQTKKAQSEELFKSEERFALAMRGASDGLWDWDLITDKVYYSPRWKSMLGYEEHELGSSLNTWASLVHPEEKDAILESVQNYLSNKSDVFEVEMRMRHKSGSYLYIRSRAFKVIDEQKQTAVRLIGTHVDITKRKKAELFSKRSTKILAMIAKGNAASEIYDEIAYMYEERHPGMRCCMLILEKDKLLYGGAPSLPKAYCDAIHGSKIGPNVGSCGTASYTGERVLCEDIATDPKWASVKHLALPYGLRSCWSEPVKDASGRVLGAFGMYYNYPGLPNDEELNDLISAVRLVSIIMDRENNLKRIKELAYTDELTGLSSRAQLYISLEKLIKESERDKLSFNLIYLDLDNFKQVNDSLGHDEGDNLLKIIASRLTNLESDIKLAARLGGDEFCIIAHDNKDKKSQVIELAKLCLKTISKPVILSGRKFIPTCSLGIARYPIDGNNLTSLLKAADTALYSAKEQGKNGYAFYKIELTQKAEYRFKMEQYLREAIEHEQLTLVYQCQVAIENREVVGVEALARWHHPLLGDVSPNDFIPIAERIGMIKPLTHWVLKQAAKQAVIWKKQGINLPRIAVNISPNHFLESDFVGLIEDTLQATELDAKCLKLEVTESAVQIDRANLDTFNRLKEIGVLIAIDDFGTGYSSFASLKHLHVDVLKIDKYFINDLLTNLKARHLYSSMIEMGQKLGYEIIAEGVEDQAQLALLTELGCDTVQGFIFSRPKDAKETQKCLSKFS